MGTVMLALEARALPLICLYSGFRRVFSVLATVAESLFKFTHWGNGYIHVRGGIGRLDTLSFAIG